MSAFKTYVIKEYIGRRVYEREIQIALKVELEAERAGTPPDLSTALPTKMLVKALNNDTVLANLLKGVAAQKGAQVFVPKKTFVEKVKGWFA